MVALEKREILYLNLWQITPFTLMFVLRSCMPIYTLNRSPLFVFQLQNQGTLHFRILLIENLKTLVPNERKVPPTKHFVSSSKTQAPK